MITSIEIPRGAADNFIFTITKNGTTVDLTTCKVGFYVARFPGAVPFITKLNTEGGGGDDQIELLAQTGDTKGQCKVKIVSGDTALIAPGKFSFDLWVDDGVEPTQVQPPTPFIVSAVVGQLA